MENQPPIYHACIQLAKSVYRITTHLPKRINYAEGAEMRHVATELVRDCLLANRAMNGSTERAMMQARMADDIAMIEALIAILTETKICKKNKGGGQCWDYSIDGKQEAELQEIIAKAGKQLYGWRHSR